MRTALYLVLMLVLTLAGASVLALLDINYLGSLTVGIRILSLAFVVACSGFLTLSAINFFVNGGRPITLDKLQKRVYYVVEGVVDLTDRKDGFSQIVILRDARTTETLEYCVSVKLTAKLPENFIISGFYVLPHYNKGTQGVISLVVNQTGDKKEMITMLSSP